MADIRVPTLGESVTEATVGKWFKQPGDAVAVDEPLVELETDKVTLEVPAPAAGVLGRHRGQERRHRRCRRAARADQGGRRRGGQALNHARHRDQAGRQRDRRARRENCKDQADRCRPGESATPSKCRCRRRSAKWRRKAASTRPRSRAPALHGQVTKGDMMAAIERAAAQPTPVATTAARCRCARRRRPTMPRAKSACT